MKRAAIRFLAGCLWVMTGCDDHKGSTPTHDAVEANTDAGARNADAGKPNMEPDGGSKPVDVADAWSGYDLDWGDCEHEIWDLAKRSPPPQGLARVYDGEVLPFTLSVVGDYVYFRTDSGIQRLPTTGGEATTVVAATNVGGYVADGRFLYWTQHSDGADDELWVSSASGQEARRLLAQSEPFTRLLPLEDGVAWMEDSGNRLRFAPHNGEPARTLYENFRQFDDWAQVAGRIFVRGHPNQRLEHDLYELSRDGSTKLIVTTGGGFSALYVASGALYWLESAGSGDLLSLRRYRVADAANDVVLTTDNTAVDPMVVGSDIFWSAEGTFCEGYVHFDMDGSAPPRVLLGTDSNLVAHATSATHLYFAAEGPQLHGPDGISWGEGKGIYRIELPK